MIIILPLTDNNISVFDTVRALDPADGDTVIAVSDGYGRPAACPNGVIWLENRLPRGKGSAIKTAFSYIQDHGVQDTGLLIWMDGHIPEANLLPQIRELFTAAPAAIITGGLPERYKQVNPLRKAGYFLTRYAFAFASGIRMQDLCPAFLACSASRIPQLLALSGDGQGYVTHLLVWAAQQKIPVLETQLCPAAVFPKLPPVFTGFWSAYAPLLLYVGSSFASFLAEYIIFLIMVAATRRFEAQELMLTINTVSARILSSILNFFLNRCVVFKHKDAIGPAIVKYGTVMLLVLVLHVLFMQLMVSIIGMPEAVAFPISECVLFAAGGILQRIFVFPHDEETHPE